MVIFHILGAESVGILVAEQFIQMGADVSQFIIVGLDKREVFDR